jgi:hypothetical protein
LVIVFSVLYDILLLDIEKDRKYNDQRDKWVTRMKTGTIKADRHSSGIVPVLTDIWNIFVRVGAMWLAYSWSSLAGIPSGPVAL